MLPAGGRWISGRVVRGTTLWQCLHHSGERRLEEECDRIPAVGAVRHDSVQSAAEHAIGPPLQHVTCTCRHQCEFTICSLWSSAANVPVTSPCHLLLTEVKATQQHRKRSSRQQTNFSSQPMSLFAICSLFSVANAPVTSTMSLFRITATHMRLPGSRRGTSTATTPGQLLCTLNLPHFGVF